MAEITNEKRVLISPDRATLADYVANRFLRNAGKRKTKTKKKAENKE